MAGLLGIGGGGIMVPALTSIFLLNDIPVENVVHLALGTTMAAIITTSISSLRAHNSKGGVLWPVVRQMLPGILFGAFLATFLVPYINSLYLALFFSLFMTYVAIQLFIDLAPKSNRQLGDKKHLLLAGTGIGAVSSLVSIGGGSITVPYLSWHNIEIKKAIGTSAAIGLPISIAGTLGYIINGWDKSATQDGTIGFVYLPAVLFISLASYTCAPIGAKLAHKLPTSKLKKIFSILLMILSIQMLTSVILGT